MFQMKSRQTVLVLDWLVGEDHDDRSERSGLNQFERLLLAPLTEETLPAAQGYRIDHESIFVDESPRVKRVDQLAAAENQDILTGLLLQPGQFFRQITRDQRGIPCHFTEGRGPAIFGQPFHPPPISPCPGHMRPRRAKPLIGPAPQQRGIGFKEPPAFPLLLAAPPKVQAPPAVFEPFRAAWIFDDAIQRHKLGNNDFSHRVFLSEKTEESSLPFPPG